MNRKRIILLTCLFFLISIFIGCAPSNETLMNEELALSARNLGEKYMLERDYPKAIKELNRAAQLNPKDHITQNYLGLSFRARAKATRNPTSKTNFLDLSVKHYEKALKLNPDYSIARNNLGNVYMDQKKWDEAIACYVTVTNDLVYSTPYFPLSNLGWAYYNKKEYETAEKYYLDALKLQPKFLLAMLGLGRTYIAMERTSDAVGVLKKASELYPQTPEVYLDLADAYIAAQQTKNAIDSYRKVIQLSPNSVLAYKANKELIKLDR